MDGDGGGQGSAVRRALATSKTGLGRLAPLVPVGGRALLPQAVKADRPHASPHCSLDARRVWGPSVACSDAAQG